MHPCKAAAAVSHSREQAQDSQAGKASGSKHSSCTPPCRAVPCTQSPASAHKSLFWVIDSCGHSPPQPRCPAHGAAAPHVLAPPMPTGDAGREPQALEPQALEEALARLKVQHSSTHAAAPQGCRSCVSELARSDTVGASPRLATHPHRPN